MKAATRSLALISALCCVGLVGISFAQLNPFAPPEAIDQASAGSVSGGLSANTYINRAQQAAAPRVQVAPTNPYSSPNPYDPVAPPSAPFAPAPAVPGEFVGAEGGAPASLFGPGVAPGQPGAPGTLPEPEKKHKVLTGERVICAVCGTLLEDYHYREVPDSQLEQFYDDATHGDLVAGDGTYTNIKDRKDVLGPECNLIMSRILILLGNAQDLDPLEFFRLHAATNEPVSQVAKLSAEESLRDDKLRLWGDQFLRDYRVDPNDRQSAFYPIWIPEPPRTPDFPHPPNLNIKLENESATLSAQQLQQQQFGANPYGGGEGGPTGAEGEFAAAGQGQYYAPGGKF